MKNLVVNEKQNNQKLDKVLWDFFPNLKQNTLYKALRKKDICINEKRISENVIVHTGDTIKVFINDELLESSPNYSIVYEDDFILVVNKPSNIEVVGDNSLTSSLEKERKFIKPCHRIDRNTLGLVLFAKSEEALTILLDKFKNKEIEKHYRATVYGILPTKKDRLEAYLFKDNKKSLVYISNIQKKGYQKIITSYNVIQENRNNNTSILDINLETGKTHQIRAHLAYIGYPIIGDR
ncbi:MAG: RluA family pseudouridine synthase [Clostridiaceae bacterium]|nr:RluA family pseudouridine synthase [Clostridiaceae bacterium]